LAQEPTSARSLAKLVEHTRVPLPARTKRRNFLVAAGLCPCCDHTGSGKSHCDDSTFPAADKINEMPSPAATMYSRRPDTSRASGQTAPKTSSGNLVQQLLEGQIGRAHV